MAENQFPSTVDALLKGMDNFITTKTVVGEPLKVEDAVIIPLMDVSCGMGLTLCPEFQSHAMAEMGSQDVPSAILVIQNGMTRLQNIRHQTPVTKALGYGAGSGKPLWWAERIFPREAMEKAEDMKAGYEAGGKKKKK